jgi:ATP-dependent RNA helicase RhlE
MSFDSLGLDAGIVRAVTEHGYTQPTPIQLAAIPAVLAGRDLLAGAQTGTGKTAGFVLPILQRLTHSIATADPRQRRRVRVLILTPTRELAAQVEQSVRTYGKYTPVKSTVVFGGVGMQPQVERLAQTLDVLVATPGRLLDHVGQRTLDLSTVETLVLDEADRMLDMGFIHDVKRILRLLPAKRQNLLFSATFSDEIRELAGTFLRNPATVEVARRNTPAELVAQVAHPVDASRKRELLAHLVKSNDWRQVLVFTRTKHGANRLAEQLRRAGIDADAIHGNKSQNARTRALRSFKDNALRVLVATDIAARGLDIVELPHVVNFDLPHVAEDYVHRIGRTGRAGSSGDAVSLVSREEQPLLAAIERLIQRRIEQRPVPGFERGSQPATHGHQPPHHRPHGHRTEHGHRQGHRQEQKRSGAPARPAQNPQHHPAQSPQRRPTPSQANRPASRKRPPVLLGGLRRD